MLLVCYLYYKPCHEAESTQTLYAKAKGASTYYIIW